MDRKTALKASRILVAIEELERFEDQLVDLIDTLEDTDNYQDIGGPMRDLVRKVLDARHAELEGL